MPKLGYCVVPNVHNYVAPKRELSAVPKRELSVVYQMLKINITFKLKKINYVRKNCKNKTAQTNSITNCRMLFNNIHFDCICV